MNKTVIKRIALGSIGALILWSILFTSEKEIVYSTVTLEQSAIFKKIEFTALWYPVSYSKVSLGTVQDIKKIYVKEGDRVLAGQVIVQLTDDLEYNQFKTAQTSYYSAINNKNAAEKAAAELPPNPSTNTQITQLKGAINTAYYQMKTAEVSVNKKKLKALLSGNIVAVVYEDFSGSSSAGSLSTSLTASAASGGNYIIIANNKDARLSLTLSEQDVVQLKKGMNVSMTSRVSEKIYSGEILSVAKIPVVQLSSTTEEPSYKVVIKLDSYIVDIPYGSRLEGSVKIAEKQSTGTVPYDAVTIDSASEGSVLILNNGKTEKKTVKIGIVGEDLIEVTEGLSTTDQVVIDNISTKSIIVLRPWIKNLISK
jgi:multidrug efflux pump subunit AcrA (membrane-fusion protein)